VSRLTERIGDFIAAAVLLLVGASALIVSWHMPAGRFGDVGPGFFPSILGVVLTLVALAIGTSNVWRRDGETVVALGHRDSWAIAGGLLVLAVFFDIVGALPMIGLYVLFLLKLLSRLGWVKCVVFAAVTVVGGYVVFDVLLGIPLPAGILF
jgi:putative tricarboxylic transport membrane protein